MTTIFLEDSFDSAHWLPNVPDGHKCHRMHGHTYRVRLEISGELDQRLGWVMDYSKIKAHWDLVKLILDHQTLNSVEGLENSTSENISRWIWGRMKPIFKGLSRVEVRETERCGAYYYE